MNPHYSPITTKQQKMSIFPYKILCFLVQKRLHTRTDGIYFEIILVYLHIATRLTLMNIRRTSIFSHLLLRLSLPCTQEEEME
jgi:hypothetical protein